MLFQKVRYDAFIPPLLGHQKRSVVAPLDLQYRCSLRILVSLIRALCAVKTDAEVRDTVVLSTVVLSWEKTACRLGLGVLAHGS